MRFKLITELLTEDESVEREFDVTLLSQILQSFDQIDWEQQKVWGFLEENQGIFPFFQVEDLQSGRKIGGLFVVYSRYDFNFIAHAELYQKQQKSHLFGLFKSEEMPSFDNEDLPFDVFRNCLELFVKGRDSEIEQIFQVQYPSYNNTGVFDR